jgi:hypothetical protein
LGRPILYTVDNNNETLEIFQTEVVWAYSCCHSSSHSLSGCICPCVTYLSIVQYFNYLCQISVKQIHQYVSLIGREIWININDFSKACDQVQWQNWGEGKELWLVGHVSSLTGW